MATQFARTQAPAVPVPFLLRDSALHPVRNAFAEALSAAVAAEGALGPGRKPCQRIARLLCELGKRSGCAPHMPLSRSAIAAALGISLIRVKRTMALLSLSGVVCSDSDSLKVMDWRKLSGLARVDPAGLGFRAEDEELPKRLDEEEPPRFLTAGGDPACFV